MKTDKTLNMVFLEKANQMANSMRDDPDYSDSVGGEMKDNFEYNGINFRITVCAFWENVHHFDYSVKGIGHNYSSSQNCIEF